MTAITILEIVIIQKEKKELISKTSLGKMVNSDEGFADVWYFILYQLISHCCKSTKLSCIELFPSNINQKL